MSDAKKFFLATLIFYIIDYVIVTMIHSYIKYDSPSADNLYAEVTELQLRVLHLTRPVDFAVTQVF